MSRESPGLRIPWSWGHPTFLVGAMALCIVLTAPDLSAQSGPGHITYRVGEKVYRVSAEEGATPQDVSQALDSLSLGSDVWLNISPDGEWLLLLTGRFDPYECAGFECLALVDKDLTAAEVVRANGEVIHADGFSAVASGGNLIVYMNSGGPHVRDLWAISRSGNGWSAPGLLTGDDSAYQFNHDPAISADGSKVVFECGDESFPATAICEVNTDGTGFRVVLTMADSPLDTGALRSPDYTPDGSIVFEAEWDGERIWRLPVGAAEPVKVPLTNDFPNDNTPCVLPDGRIASLWLGRPENLEGLHEIKVMSPDGSSYFMVLTGVDVFDLGIGCGGGASIIPLAVGASVLSEGEVGVGYSEDLEISGGSPPYEVSVVKGALPAGLTVDSDGLISGTPTQGKTSSFTVQVTDQDDTSVSKKLKIKVFKAVVITTKSLKKGKVEKKYAAALKAAGGKKSYMWSITSGSLPSGLTLDETTGKITGMPTAAGSSDLTFSVTDFLGGMSEKPLTLIIQ